MKKIKDLVSKIVKAIKSSSLTAKIVAGVTTLAVVATAIVLPQVKLSKTDDIPEDDNNNNDTSTLAKKENSVAPNTAKATEIDATIDDEADEILEAKVEQKEENKKEEEKPKEEQEEQKPQTPSTTEQKPQTPQTPSTPQQKPQTPSTPQQEQKPQTPSKPSTPQQKPQTPSTPQEKPKEEQKPQEPQKPQVTDWKYDASLSAQLQSRFDVRSTNNYGQKDTTHRVCTQAFLSKFFSIADSYFYGNISQSQAESQIRNIDGTVYENGYGYSTTEIGSIYFDDFTVSSLTSVNISCQSCCFKVAVYTNGSGNFRVKRIVLATSTRALEDDW